VHAFILIAPASLINPGAVAQHFQRRWPEEADVLVVQPTEKVSIGIEDIRNLQTQLSTSPLSEQGRLVIITPGSALSLPAQQALLKMVEEPPPQTQMVLASTSLHVFLPTMQSRCQVITVHNKLRDSFGNRRSGEGGGDTEDHSTSASAPLFAAVSEAVAWAQQLPNKKAELENWLTAALHNLLQADGVGDSPPNRYQQLQALNQALLQVRHNVTPSLVTHALALQLITSK
jgi:DNA polymerase-3 subunit delta'